MGLSALAMRYVPPLTGTLGTIWKLLVAPSICVRKTHAQHLKRRKCTSRPVRSYPRTGRSICKTLLEGGLGVGARSLPAFAGPCGADVAARAYPVVPKSGVGVFPAGGARGGFPARAKGRNMARATGMTTPKPSLKRKSDPRTNLARRIKSLLIPVAK